MIPHCILEDDLVLYALGELEGERLKHLEAHVELCPECQKRINQYRRLRRHLSGVSSAGDSSPQRDALKRRIQAEANGPPLQSRRSRKRWSWSWQPTMALVLVLVAAVALVSVSDVEGRFPFASYVGLAPEEYQQEITAFIEGPGELPGPSIRENLESRDIGLAVPEDRRIPENLPLGLYQTESYVHGDGSVVHYYGSTDYGLEMTISLGDAETSRTRIPAERAVLAEVNGVEVLVDRESAREANGVLWIDDGVLFNVAIVRAFGGLTLTPEQLMSIAEAIMLDRAGN